MLTYRGIQANPEKMQDYHWNVKSWKYKRNSEDDQSTCNSLQICSEVSRKKKPIVQLLQKAFKFKWTDKLFLHLKAFLVAPLVIQKYDTYRPIII